MGRIRRSWESPPKPFDKAIDTIATWERRVCYSTVTHDGSLRALTEWLYPQDVLELLRTAYEFTSESHPDRTETIRLHHDNGTSTFELRFDCDDAKVLTPKAGLAVQQADQWRFVTALLDYERIVKDWNVVRTVVSWFNENATPGCARYYFPAMGNFLSSDHAFHQGETTRFAPPKQSISQIAPLVRQAAEIVTMALFCPHNEKRDNTGMYLTVLVPSSTSGQTSKSQLFFF